MTDHFDPTKVSREPAETPLDLAPYAPLVVSDHSHRALDEAVSRGPQPIALQNLDFLARQQNQDDGAKPGRFGRLFKREKSNEDPTQEEKPTKKGMTRRGFLTKAAVGAAGAYGVYRGVGWVNAPQDYHLALLHEDDNGHMGLVHREFSTDNTDGLKEPGKVESLSAESLGANGLESLVISPEMKLRALPRDRHPTEEELRERALHKHDPQEIKIKGTARNIYIPYHLFKDACRFNLDLHTEQELVAWDGKLNPGEREQTVDGQRMKVVPHPKLRISIWGYPEPEDVPIGMDISTGATNAKDAAGDAATGLWNRFTTLPDQIAEATGLGDGVNEAEELAKQQAEAIRRREIAKPKPQVEPKFMIELDYVNDQGLPDLLFYNGQTVDAPTYRIKREDIAHGLRDKQAANDIPGMHLITHNGMVSDIAIDGGLRKPQGVRYVDNDLMKAAHAANSTGNTSPKDGLLKAAWNGLKEITWEDDKLSKKESGALVMATRFQQKGLDHRHEEHDGSFTGVLGERGRGMQTFANRFVDRLDGEPDLNVGR